MSRFIIAAGDLSSPQQDAITTIFREREWPFWHWIENVWLLAEVPDEVTPRALWDEITALEGMQDINGIAIRLGPEPLFWGSNPAESWNWMARYWGHADSPKSPSRRIPGRI